MCPMTDGLGAGYQQPVETRDGSHPAEQDAVCPLDEINIHYTDNPIGFFIRVFTDPTFYVGTMTGRKLHDLREGGR